jgi:hypothetical protein
MKELDASLFGLTVAPWYGSALVVALLVIAVALCVAWFRERRAAMLRASAGRDRLARFHFEPGPLATPKPGQGVIVERPPHHARHGADR